MLNVAGTIVMNAGFALPGETTHWALTPAKLAAAGLEPEQVEAAGREAQLLFTRRRAALY